MQLQLTIVLVPHWFHNTRLHNNLLHYVIVCLQQTLQWYIIYYIPYYITVIVLYTIVTQWYIIQYQSHHRCIWQNYLWLCSLRSTNLYINARLSYKTVYQMKISFYWSERQSISIYIIRRKARRKYKNTEYRINMERICENIK